MTRGTLAWKRRPRSNASPPSSTIARAVLFLRFELDLVQYQIAAAVGCSQMHVSRTLAASLEALRTQPGARALMDAFPLAMAA